MYVAPALRKREEDGADVAGSEAQQRASWDALKRALNGLINKVSAANIKNIAPELFRVNIVRGRGLLCRALMRAQHASPAFTQVYAALVAVVNTKVRACVRATIKKIINFCKKQVPDVGELLLHRLVDQFRRAFRRNHREALLSSVRFIAHLLNQQVCSEALGLELCALLLERPTEDSVEIAVEFIRECGYALQEQSPRGFNVVFESLRNVLHEGRIELRVQYIVEELFALRKQGFPGHTGVAPELDLVEAEDQVVHDVALDMDVDVHEELNYFRPDEHFLEAEEQWKAARREILGESSDEGDGDAEDDEGEEEDEDDATAAAAAAQQTVVISDQTTTELLNLKKSVYLTIMSSLDFEECAHKLLKMQLQPGQDEEVAKMIVECCSQERTYLRFYGLLAERFCRLNKSYQEIFERLFLQQYSTIHHLETNKLRNVAKLFAHLMHTDAISWAVLEFVHLNEAETTSSSRIFIKILFQEISEFMGLANLIARLREPALQRQFAGLFPRDNPRNTRFSINFFTSIGLGALTCVLVCSSCASSQQLNHTYTQRRPARALEDNAKAHHCRTTRSSTKGRKLRRKLIVLLILLLLLVVVFRGIIFIVVFVFGSIFARKETPPQELLRYASFSRRSPKKERSNEARNSR